MLKIEDVYPWLNQFSKSALSLPARQMVDRLEQAAKVGDLPQMYSLLQHLSEIGIAIHGDRELGEIRCACGMALYRIGEHAAALEHFRSALRSYQPYPHERAVVQWIVGSICFDLGGMQDKAIMAWKYSIEAFNTLADKFSPQKSGSQWYQARLFEMVPEYEQVIQGIS